MSNANPLNQRSFRETLGIWPTGVSVVTGIDVVGDPVGMVIGSFSSVSLEPPLVSFCPQKTLASWAAMRTEKKFCVNILTVHQQAFCRRFSTGDQAERFTDIELYTSASGLPLLPRCAAWIEADVVAEYDGGDHWIVLGQVISLERGIDAPPLIFAKGKLYGLGEL